jgi:hypothetical protein
MEVEMTPIQDMPLDRLEREITELAAHINAATCRWLSLVGELERREGWAEWGYNSCAHWLSVRCGVAPGTAREQVRVARRLTDLPATRARFARGELSYSQVRALTRVATPEIEDELLSIARYATGGQLEVLARAYRGVLANQPGAAGQPHRARYVTYSYDHDGSLLIRARLAPEEGALVVKALEAARDAVRQASAEDVSAETPADGVQGEGVSAETPAGLTRASNADALTLMAETLLASGPARSDAAERYQVVVHVDASTLSDDEGAGACQLERGAALHPETARRLACDTSLIRVLERDGRPLSVGRRTRSVPRAVKRALRTRDGGCRFPGCSEHRFVDAHHIEHWSRGGETKLSNLVQLCRRHHRLVHEGGFRLERGAGDAILFRRPDGRAIPARTRLRGGDCAQLTDQNMRGGLEVGPETCVPKWWGDRLDKTLAVDCLAARDPRLMEPPLRRPLPAWSG